jgi:parallel beta-helix repeat protein
VDGGGGWWPAGQGMARLTLGGWGWRGGGRLEENQVSSNRRSGLVVMDSARAALRGNRFADNSKCGVLCHGAGVRVALVGDSLARNIGSGLVIQASRPAPPARARSTVSVLASATRGWSRHARLRACR